MKEDYERVRKIVENFIRSPELSKKELAFLAGFDNTEIPDYAHRPLDELREHLIKYLAYSKLHEKFLEESISILTNNLEMKRSDLSKEAQNQVTYHIENFKKIRFGQDHLLQSHVNSRLKS